MSIMELIERTPCPKGLTQIFSANPETGKISNLVMEENAIMADASDCMARQGAGDMRYAVKYMYMQFENMASSGDTPVVPAFSQGDGVSYFTNLQVHATQDFIRVPILQGPAFSDTDSSYNSNIVTFVAVSGGFTEGYWGKPFNEANFSAVFGGALVASPTGLQEGDKIYARNYPTGAKILKPANEQIVMQWTLEFTAPTPY